MTWVAVGVGAASLVGGIAGSMISSNAASSAADKQVAAANHAADLQNQQYQQQRTDQEPWRQAGLGALGQMGDPSFQHDFSMSDFQADPGYDFRMQEGQKALERSAAARGGLMTGGTMKALTQYGQDYASNEYQNAYNRFTNNQAGRFNRLASLAGIGQTATNQVGQAGMNYANQAGEAMMGAGNAAASARIAQGNAWSAPLSNLGNAGTNWMMYSLLNRKANPGGTTPATPMGGQSYLNTSGIA